MMEMDGINSPNDVRVQVRMGKGEAQNKLHRRHAFKQIIEAYLLPPVPLHPSLLPLGGSALGRPTPNDNTDGCKNHGGLLQKASGYRLQMSRERQRISPAQDVVSLW